MGHFTGFLFQRDLGGLRTGGREMGDERWVMGEECPAPDFMVPPGADYHRTVLRGKWVRLYFCLGLEVA
jgi:hypothetical protein